MKKHRLSIRVALQALAIVVISLVTALPVAADEVIVLEKGWKFAKGDHPGANAQKFDDAGWATVSVPHDWAIEGPFIRGGDGNTGKLPWKGEGWYRRTLDVTASMKGRTVYLLCDGIMSSPQVYVNGKKAGGWDYGYMSFYLDITPFLHFDGKDMLAIHADTRQHDSRWYPGAGIFRKVSLLVTSPVHAGINETFVIPHNISDASADLTTLTRIVNNSATEASGVVAEQVIFDPSGREVAHNTVTTTIPANGSQPVEFNCRVRNPVRWDINRGELYSAWLFIRRNGVCVDTSTQMFGIRTIAFTADDGFHLNGKRVQLKGVNLHHDLGPLGAAFNIRAAKRQLDLLQAMGCNAIRTSHNPPAPELLQLCDLKGILVFDELFDKYDGKADFADTTDFNEFSARNVRNFIMRDRNHPSVFIYSVGNEMGDVQNNLNGGFAKLQTMLNNVKQYDTTRPLTMVCDNRASAAKRHFDMYDVHCWNYGRRYDLARELEPSKAVIISESSSTVSTRGFYELPLPAKKTDFTRSMQVSSYDLNAPEWAELADDDFMWGQDEPYVAGEFAWTGFDYLGEPTPYTNEWAKSHGMSDSAAAYSSYFGILDLGGIPKDRYYLYKSYWKPEETTVHILPHWNYPGLEGTSIPVFVYTNGDCAELFLNGKSLGKRCKSPGSKVSTERFRLIWNDVPYEPGTLKAVAYKNNLQIGEATVKTAGEPATIRLTPDRSILQRGNKDLSYILIEAIDSEGNPCPLAMNRFTINVGQPASIAGVTNGNPHAYEPFHADSASLFYGKAILIIRSGEKSGPVKVTVKGEGLPPATAPLEIQ